MYIKQLRAVGVAQAVEHLPSKCKALSSDLSTTEKKKAREREIKKTVKILEYS
jgi:hypothetical protein